MNYSTGRRIILLGKNGSGKSSVGISLLGRYVFSDSKLSKCKQIKDFSLKHDISLNIIDTPGLFDADVSLAEGALEIQKSLDICPDPHAFLIVVNTNDDKEYLNYTVDILSLIFGEKVFDNAIVFVNQRDEYAADSWVNEHQLVSRCGRRVVTAKSLDVCMDEVTGAAILMKVSLMTCNGVSVYSHQSKELHRRVLNECLPVCRRGDDIRSQLYEMNARLKEMLEKKQSSDIQSEVKVIMIGKSGNGKSSTGNTLLGHNGFTVARRINAVTETCQMETGFLRNQQIIKVVDTPGLFDAGNTLGRRALEIQKAVEICPNPNAFLLVLSSGRFTEEELCTVKLIRIIFGREIFEHMCIVFTHGSEFQDIEAFRNFWEESEYVTDLVERCNGRVFKIENSNENRYADENFLNLIDAIKSRPEYEYRYLDEHRAALQEHLDEYTSQNQDINSQIEDFDVRLSNRIDSKKLKERLITGATIVGSVAATTGVGVLAGPKAAAKTAFGLGVMLVATYSINKLSK